MKKLLLTNLKGDFSGGFSAAMLSLPGNIIYGMLGFEPLGPSYAGMGILAGIYASVFAGFAATYFGGSRGMITTPCASMVLVFASVLLQMLTIGLLDPASPNYIMLVISVGFFTVFLSGIIQILFGKLKLSNLIKYISAPVIAGIANGTAFLIIRGATCDYLGLSNLDLQGIISQFGDIQPLTVIVALSSTLLWIYGKKLIPQVPGPVLGLLGGTAVYYLISYFGFGDQLGLRLASVQAAIPTPKFGIEFIHLINHDSFFKILPIVLSGAVTIAILGSIETLLATLTLQNLTNERANGNKELTGQGIGNIVNSLFGALPSGGAVSRVMVNYKAGGRTKMSGFFYALVTLVFVLGFSGYISYLPKAVTAGMAVVIAYLILDKWSIRLLLDLFKHKTHSRRELIINVGVIILVMFIVVEYNIIYAVTAGIIISIILFIEQMGKSVVRRTFRGSKLHSTKQRYFHVMDKLNEQGNQIAILELEGALFFGATDSLSNEIDMLVTDGAKYILLDFKRVRHVDVSGAKFLDQTVNQMRAKGVQLVISYVYAGTPARNTLEDMGVIRTIGSKGTYPDTDQALEYCEDQLLESLKSEQDNRGSFTLQDFFGIGVVDVESLQRLEKYVRKVEFQQGELVFKQGDRGDAAFIITEGSAAITLTLPDLDRSKRLVTLSFGTIFGEMALLDSGLRSANVEALEKLVCIKISLEEYLKMRNNDPDVAMILTDTITRVLVSRLRQANQTISELEQ